MPLKSILRLLWISNLVFLAIIGLLVFFVAWNIRNMPTLAAIDITPRQKLMVSSKFSLDHYRDIWEARILIDAPKTVIDEGPKVPADWHRELVQRSVKIEQILTTGYAFVSINNQDPVLLEALNPSNKIDRTRPWEVKLQGNKLTALEIVPGKGIRFRFDAGNKEVWLEDRNPRLTQPGKSEEFKSQQIAPNHWAVTSQDGTQLLQNGEQHLQALQPALEYDTEGNAIGIRIRGDISQSSDLFKYGLRKDDIVKSVNGSPLNSDQYEYFRQLVQTHRTSKKIEIELLRGQSTIKLTFDVIRKP